MTVLAFLLILAAVALMVYTHRRLQKNLAAMLVREQQAIEDLRLSQNKQAKALVKRLAASNNAAAKMIDETRKSQDHARYLREDTQALQATINEMLSDPRVKRLLNGGE